MAIAQLHNKQVLITGAGSGIGRAAALAFAKRGAHIIASDINLVPLQSLQAEVQALGVECQIYSVDVANDNAMREFAEQVHSRISAVDVLINNAGIGYIGQFLDSDLAHWQRVLNINVMGVVHGCYHFLPKMLEAGGERQVLNVASSASNFPTPTMAAYAASKYAVNGLTEVLRMELANSQIGVTTVCPGVINTAIVTGRSNMAASVTEDQLQRLQAYYDSEGCTPDLVAEGMVKAVLSGQNLLLVGPYAKLVYHLKRLSNALVRKVMLASAYKVGYL